MTDAWEMHQAETGLNPGPVWRDRGVIINTLTERNQALEERVAELEGSCQKLRDDYQGALAREAALRARIEALADEYAAAAKSREENQADEDGRTWGVEEIARVAPALRTVEADLRAALASPAVDTTPEGRPMSSKRRMAETLDHVRQIASDEFATDDAADLPEWGGDFERGAMWAFAEAARLLDAALAPVADPSGDAP